MVKDMEIMNKVVWTEEKDYDVDWNDTKEVKGTLKSVEVGDFGKKEYLIECGTQKITCPGTTVLDRKMKGFVNGDIVKIMCEGLKQGKENSYFKFRTFKGKLG